MRYDPALDGIRAIAVIPVLMAHAGVPFLNAGFLGVDIFFVLSGFLITRVLTEEYKNTAKIRIGQFYIRRARRLYPALLLFLLVYLAVAFALWPSWQHHLRDAFFSAIYIQDYAKSFNYKPLILIHLWSLSVEEHFYLIAPLALIGLLKLRSRSAILVLIAVWILASLWRVSEVQRIGHEHNWWRIYDRFDTHATGLIFGTLLGFLNYQGGKFWLLAAAAILSFVASTFEIVQHNTAILGFTITEIGAACLIIGRQPWMGAAVLAWIGRMSYGFYLWHLLVVRVCRAHGLSWEWKLVLGGVIGMMLAAISYYKVEIHFRARRPEADLDGTTRKAPPAGA